MCLRRVLDENLGKPRKRLPRNCINAKDIAGMGRKDNDVLDIASRYGMIVVTQDKKMVIKAARKGYDIIWQDEDGTQFYIPTSGTQKLSSMEE